MLALLDQGIKVDKYVAYEIDKYAVKTATHNFPEIEQRGDVFDADFTEFRNFDYLMGGSPCTYWSIAQKNNRETEASGLGWELFSQYVRALREAQPKYFIYENNKSMSNAIRESITETFGFEPICINSALLSAQNRQRLYWVGKRNTDGIYSKVEIEQPVDKGILLKDILETGEDWQHNNFISEPVNMTADGKAQCLRATCYKDGIRNMVGNDVDKRTCVAETVRVGSLPRPNGELSQSQAFRVYDIKGKSVNLTSGGGGAGGKTGLYAVPLKVGEVNGGGQGNRIYSVEGKAVSQTATSGSMGSNTGLYAVPVESKTVEKAIPDIVDKFGYLPEMFNAYNRAEIKDKAPTLSTGSMVTSSCAVNRIEKICCFAEPCEWYENDKPTKATSYADGKTYQVYEVKRGSITIKGKEYPIKLADGYYIIRKLTVRECMRLQTVPEWYDFSIVSDTQAYKMLGNGWTVAVISYLLSHTLE